MIVTRNPELASRCRIMRTHGIDRDAFDRFTAAQTKPSWYYEIVAPGFKYNMPDLSAAIGIHQLAKACKFQQQRAAIVQQYMDAFKDMPITLPPVVAEGDLHAWHLFVIELKIEDIAINRNRFIEQMAANGIGAGVHYMPLHMHPYWKQTYHLNDDMFPVSTAAFQRIISLPLFPDMQQDEIDTVIAVVKDICREQMLKAA